MIDKLLNDYLVT